jgi:polyhydroxyalkanoate synthesis regulator phasin
MAITDDQYDRLVNRITRLEETCNNLIVAQSRLISLTQVNQLLTLIQTQVQDLSEQVEALEDRVSSIEEEPLS